MNMAGALHKPPAIGAEVYDWLLSYSARQALADCSKCGPHNERLVWIRHPALRISF